MGLKRWMAGLLGFGNHETNHNDNHNDNHNHNDQNNNSDNNDDEHPHQQQEEEINHNNNNYYYIKSNRKGFSVPVQVPAQQIGPVLIPCRAGDGGLQGLGWYTKRLRVDEDGDVADEFFEEVFSETSNTEAHHKHFPKFEVKVNTKSAKARNPVLSREGTIQQVVEYRGRFLLV